MSYRIIWDEKASDFLKRLDKQTIQRILKKVSSVVDDPAHYLEPLVGISSYKLRVGDYRLLIDIDKGRLLLTIIFYGTSEGYLSICQKNGIKN